MFWVSALGLAMLTVMAYTLALRWKQARQTKQRQRHPLELLRFQGKRTLGLVICHADELHGETECTIWVTGVCREEKGLRLEAWCEMAGATRIFPVDRVEWFLNTETGELVESDVMHRLSKLVLNRFSESCDAHPQSEVCT